MKQYTKNRGITHEEFDQVRQWWKNRKSNGNAWKVSIKEIKGRNYNLDFKNPNKKDDLAHKSPEEIMDGIEAKEQEITSILNQIRKKI